MKCRQKQSHRLREQDEPRNISGHHSGRGRGLVSPVRRQLLRQAVVPRQSVDPRLDQDKPELRVTVLPVPLQVLPHRHRLLDQVVQVLGNVRGET